MIKFYDAMGPSQGIAALSDVVDALDFWQDNTAVKVGDIARSSTNSMIYAVAQTAGVTGTVEPVWGSTADVTITDNTVTWLVKDIRTADAAKSAAKWTVPIKINGIDVDGSHDITLPTDTIDGGSYIGSGLKVSSFDGLNVNISSGRAKIAGNGISFPGGQLALNPRKASLMYLDSAGTLGKVDCANPLDFVDDNTVGMWIFNQTVAGANIPNAAVGKSAIAVANDLVPHGGITSVDGWADNSLQTDGSTGYFLGSNTSNFPVSNAERELVIGFTVNNVASSYIYGYTGSVTGSSFYLFMDTSGNLGLYFGGSTWMSNFYVEKGKTYNIAFGYDGANVYIKSSGVLISKAALSVSTGNTYSVCAGTFYGSSGASSCAAVTIHFTELRNKVRNDIKTAEFSNKIIMPCFYDKSSAIYPTIPAAYAAACHEYKFDEVSGTAVADSNTTMPMTGTATGTNIIDSDIGLGKARKFNGTSDKIVTGNFSCGTKFSYVGIVTIPAYGAYALWSNRAADTKSGNLIYIDASGYLYLYRNTSAYKLTNTAVPIGTPFFVAITINGTSAITYLNSCQTSTVTTISILDGTILPVNLGFEACAANYLNGTYEYCLYGNYEITQAEIAQIYSALMFTGRRNIIDDAIPANAISLGFIRTNATKVIEKNDSWYKFGRREGATGGNRKVFLPWKYFSGAASFKWDNPFGTSKIKKEYHWAQDAKGTNEVMVSARFDYNSVSYGVYPLSCAAGYNDVQNITGYVGGAAAVWFNSVWQTTGYISCYAEVMEDYKGADAV